MKTKRKLVEKKIFKHSKNFVDYNYLSNFLKGFKERFSFTDLSSQERFEIFIDEFSKYCGDDSQDFKDYLYLLFETDPVLMKEVKKFV